MQLFICKKYKMCQKKQTKDGIINTKAHCYWTRPISNKCISLKDENYYKDFYCRYIKEHTVIIPFKKDK